MEALTNALSPEISPSFESRSASFVPTELRPIALKGEVETGQGGSAVTVFGTAEIAAGAGQGGDCPGSDCAERERFGAYFEHSPEALFVVNIRTDGRLVYQARNAAYAELSGLPIDTGSGGDSAEVVPERIAASLQRHYGECVDLGVAVTVEEILELGDGLRIWSMTLAPVPSNDGGLLGIVRDITEQRMLEASLRAARDAAEAPTMNGPRCLPTPVTCCGLRSMR